MWYNVCVKNTIYQQQYNTAKQGRFPVFFADMLNICDPVLAFDRLMEEEVLKNLNCIHGALLRQNRSIQAEGTFGIMKQDRNYRRIRRRTLDFVRTELYLVSIGHNLYKYCNKLQKQQIAA